MKQTKTLKKIRRNHHKKTYAREERKAEKNSLFLDQPKHNF